MSRSILRIGVAKLWWYILLTTLLFLVIAPPVVTGISAVLSWPPPLGLVFQSTFRVELDFLPDRDMSRADGGRRKSELEKPSIRGASGGLWLAVLLPPIVPYISSMSRLDA